MQQRVTISKVVGDDVLLGIRAVRARKTSEENAAHQGWVAVAPLKDFFFVIKCQTRDSVICQVIGAAAEHIRPPVHVASVYIAIVSLPSVREDLSLSTGVVSHS